MVMKEDAMSFLEHMKNSINDVMQDKAWFKGLPSNKWATQRSGKMPNNKRFVWFAILSENDEDIGKALEAMSDYYSKRGFHFRNITSSEQL